MRKQHPHLIGILVSRLGTSDNLLNENWIIARRTFINGRWIIDSKRNKSVENLISYLNILFLIFYFMAGLMKRADANSYYYINNKHKKIYRN